MIKKRALICGVGGQDGSYLSQFLLKKGYEVWGTSRDAEGGLFLNLEKLGVLPRVNILSVVTEDYHSVFNSVQQSNPDEIYYLAGQSSVGLSFEQPVETIQSMTLGVINFLNAIRQLNTSIKFYNAGSSECFGDSDGIPANETTCFNPRSPYGIAKVAAHSLVSNFAESYSLFACTGILFNHESTLRPERYVTQKIIKSVKNIVDGKQEKIELGRLDIARDWGWAPEYVEAMWLMLQQDAPEDYVIATGSTYSLEEFVAEAFNIFNMDWEKYVVVNDEFKRPTDIASSQANPIKAQLQLGWKARTSMIGVIRNMMNEKL